MCTEGRPWTAGVRAWVAVLCCCLPSLVLAVPLPDLGASGAGELTLTSDEQAYLQAKGRITYCPDPAWMPLESIQDGVHVGMTRDYVDYVQGLLGVPFELVVSASWSEAIEHARNRVCDVWPLAMPTPERLTYMRFTQPYMNIPLVVSTRAQALFFTDIAQLAGKPLGVPLWFANDHHVNAFENLFLIRT